MLDLFPPLERLSDDNDFHNNHEFLNPINCMLNSTTNSSVDSSSDLKNPQILLDGSPIELPRGRHSVGAIRSHLETIALENHRVLWSFNVEEPTGRIAESFNYRVEGLTMDIDDVPLRLIRIALQQTAEAKAALHKVLLTALIQEYAAAAELWWKLAKQLKQPLLTVSLLSENIIDMPPGTASVSQIRRWQLQQLGAILREANEACWPQAKNKFPRVLETRVLVWLNNLQSSLELWQETLLAARD